MFIHKRDYKALIDKVSATQKANEDLQDSIVSLATSITGLRNDQTDVLFGFATDIDELKSAFNDYGELSKEQREAYIKQAKKDIGFQNMLNY